MRPIPERDDIIVITDEAHRTQYGTLALNMRNALPHASYIGFTGTPLFKDDEITRRVFGDYVSTYDFQRAVEDRATVPLYYDARGDKLGVAVGDLNERIAEKLEELETDNIDVEQRLERELKRDYHIITADKRLDQVARDFVQHYATAWETGKAMLVCIDKITCVRMHGLIVKYWDERITEAGKQNCRGGRRAGGAVPASGRSTGCGRREPAVVVSEEQGEVEKFRKWELDITPHRRLIKEGIDLPESMRSKPQFRNMQQMELDDAFKAEQHPFRIAIVCAMWLTGFDVPSLSTLYLDKPLKAHTLMQAIARANRVNEGKNNGSTPHGNHSFCSCFSEPLPKSEPPPPFTKSSMHHPKGRSRDYEAINVIYKSLMQDREQADISDIIRQLHQVVDEVIETRPDRMEEETEAFDISNIDFDRLRQEFERSPARRTTVQNLRNAIEQRLQRLLMHNPLRSDFQKHYEEIVAEYNREKDRVTIEKTFEALIRFVNEMSIEENRAVREGLDEESLAVYDLLKKPELSAAEIKRIKSVAEGLLKIVKGRIKEIEDWESREATRDSIRLTIKDFLWSDATGLPVDRYTEDDVQARAEEVFRHVYRAYPTLPSPFYEMPAA